MRDASNAKPLLLILSIHQEMGETFVGEWVPGSSGKGTVEADIGGCLVTLGILAGDPRLNATWDEAVRKADAMVMLTRFLDVISLDKIKAIYRRLPSDKAVPLSVLVYREKDESDFKMSCPACGQKLWVRDSDVGKRGRCPNCKKPFKLPAQSNLIRAQLMIPDTVGVSVVVRGDQDSLQEAMTALCSRITGDFVATEIPIDEEILKKTTVRVQIQSDDTSSG